MIRSVDLARQHEPWLDEILEAVRAVLEHGHFILGPEVAALEEQLATFLGVAHVVGVSSGTAALRLALRAHRIGAGDEVLTVSHSYFATATAICLEGATPVFVDVDDATMLLDPSALEAQRTPRTRAVLPVHLNGEPCDMAPIEAFCRRHDLLLIEDCAQAIGASYRGRRVGSFGTGCFSLHPIKALGACGDGGFIATSDDALAAELRQLRTLGHVDRDHVKWISGNDRLDTLQAAIVLVKMRHLDELLGRRRAIAARYREALPPELIAMPRRDDREGVYAQFVIRSAARDALVEGLQARGVDTKIHYPIPIHRQEAFREVPHGPLPVTDRVTKEIVSLPISFELSDDEVEAVIAAVTEVAATLP